MLEHRKPASHRISFVVGFMTVLMWLMLCAPVSLLGQQTGAYEVELNRAIQLINEEKFDEALPIFEKLAAKTNQTDGQVMYGLGVTTLLTSDSITDEAKRREARLRARKALLRARELGVREASLDMMLSTIPPDGGVRGVSKIKEANQAMDEAGVAFAQKNYPLAVTSYERAAKLDPTLYEAALYTGNTYYAMDQWGKAGEWFARAIAIDPTRETAYRYWGDALMYQGRQEEARAKFFDAIIAEPDSSLAWRGLSQWAEHNKARLGHPQIEPPDSAKTDTGTKTPDRKDGSKHWPVYNSTRAAWSKKIFFKKYPGEQTYRHTLSEEAEALRAVAQLAAKDLKSGKVKSLDPSLATLVKLNDAGLLEAYILFARSDAGIAQDYPQYRDANRDKLVRYLTEYVVKGGGD
jgi:tetratricopeptide (TPR) repeat protein